MSNSWVWPSPMWADRHSLGLAWPSQLVPDQVLLYEPIDILNSFLCFWVRRGWMKIVLNCPLDCLEFCQRTSIVFCMPAHGSNRLVQANDLCASMYYFSFPMEWNGRKIKPFGYLWERASTQQSKLDHDEDNDWLGACPILNFKRKLLLVIPFLPHENIFLYLLGTTLGMLHARPYVLTRVMKTTPICKVGTWTKRGWWE